ncbi:unnamed protein product, partial [Pleuronectes platessa]
MIKKEIERFLDPNPDRDSQSRGPKGPFHQGPQSPLVRLIQGCSASCAPSLRTLRTLRTPPPAGGGRWRPRTLPQGKLLSAAESSLSVRSAAPQQRERHQSPEIQRHTEDVSEDRLQPIEEDVLLSPVSENHLGPLCEEDTVSEGLRRFAVWSEELTFDLLQLQRQTEDELGHIHTQLFQIEGRRQLLTSELFHLHKRKKQIEQEVRSRRQTSFHVCACRELQASITERVVQSEELVFQEEAVLSLRQLLSEDLLRFQEESERLRLFTQKILKLSHRSDGEETFTDRRSHRSMQGKTEENNM